jgi:hypothetical protein
MLAAPAAAAAAAAAELATPAQLASGTKAAATDSCFTSPAWDRDNATIAAAAAALAESPDAAGVAGPAAAAAADAGIDEGGMYDGINSGGGFRTPASRRPPAGQWVLGERPAAGTRVGSACSCFWPQMC